MTDSTLQFNGNIMTKLTIDGIPGFYSSKIVRTFHHINYFYPNPNYDPNCSYDMSGQGNHYVYDVELVGSVPAYNYGEYGIKACGNPKVNEMINEKIIHHAQNLLAA